MTDIKEGSFVGLIRATMLGAARRNITCDHVSRGSAQGLHDVLNTTVHLGQTYSNRNAGSSMSHAHRCRSIEAFNHIVNVKLKDYAIGNSCGSPTPSATYIFFYERCAQISIALHPTTYAREVEMQ